MENITSQISKLDSIFPWARNNALNNLAAIGLPAVKEIIVALDTRFAPYNTHGYNQDSLSEANRAMKRHPLLLETIVKIGKPALPELEVALRHENLNVRVSALTAIGRIGHPTAVDIIMAFMDSEHHLERASAVYALGCTRTTNALKRVVAALHDREEEVRLSAIDALGDFADESVLPKLNKIAESDKTMLHISGVTVGDEAKRAIEKIRKRANA